MGVGKRMMFFSSGSSYQSRVIGVVGRSSIVGYWPLGEPSGTVAAEIVNGFNGSYVGVDLGQPGMGDGKPAPYFDGVNDAVEVYSAGLAGAFNGAEGSVGIWCKVGSVGAWSDGALRTAVGLRADASANIASLRKSPSANAFRFENTRGGTSTGRFWTGSTGSWFHVAMTWSAAADRLRCYVDGVAQGADLTGLGTWAGSLSASRCAIGSYTAPAPLNPWVGWLSNCLVCNRELSAGEVLRIVTRK